MNPCESLHTPMVRWQIIETYLQNFDISYFWTEIRYGGSDLVQVLQVKRMAKSPMSAEIITFADIFDSSVSLNRKENDY